LGGLKWETVTLSRRERADTREDTCNLNEQKLDNCEDEMLSSLDETMTLANESLSQKDYQRLIADYYFGKFNTHAKLLYSMFKFFDTIRCNNRHSGLNEA
jgi:hypothetical protein